jgi:hypothetical protein
MIEGSAHFMKLESADGTEKSLTLISTHSVFVSPLIAYVIYAFGRSYNTDYFNI